jgi:hypothetical protein
MRDTPGMENTWEREWQAYFLPAAKYLNSRKMNVPRTIITLHGYKVWCWGLNNKVLRLKYNAIRTSLIK